MTTTIPRTCAPSTARPQRRSGAERRLARRRRLVQRGVVASYLHDISARHTPATAVSGAGRQSAAHAQAPARPVHRPAPQLDPAERLHRNPAAGREAVAFAA
jgi:hypothetical protein